MLGRTNTGGGGGGLNFQVIGGTTAPRNPKENMIWVNTSTKITSYIFSATQPTGSAGMVWIPTGTSSTVEFDALKKNGIQVYPISAKQYEDGTFVGKDAYIWQNGEFLQFSSDIVYYFKSGEGAKISFSYAKETNASVSVSNERVSGSASSTQGGGWYYQSDEKVDLAEKTELVFNAKCTFAHTDQDWKPIVFVSENPISGKVQPPHRFGTVYAKAVLTADSVQREYVLPVAELNDSYHIGYFGAGSAVIYDIFAR